MKSTSLLFPVVLALALATGCAQQMSRGSAVSLYSVSDPLEVHRQDIGKSIQLRLDQKLFFNMETDGENPGQWELVDYEKRTLLLLSDTPRTMPGYRGFLLQARALGSGKVILRFTPLGEDAKPSEARFDISIRR
jgi:hypothetical protein